MAGTYRPRREAEEHPALKTEIADGLRWLWRHRVLRTLAITLGVWNLLTTASASVFVLFATEDLHVSKAGYGLLFSAGAVGSIIGGLLATRISRRPRRCCDVSHQRARAPWPRRHRPPGWPAAPARGGTTAACPSGEATPMPCRRCRSSSGASRRGQGCCRP